MNFIQTIKNKSTNIINKVKERKGMSTLEFVICVMIFITVFTFLADMFLVLYKQYVVTSATTEISRQIGTQGGIAKTCPENYAGGNKNYLTYSELNNWIDDLNEDFFLEQDDVFVEITYYPDPNNISTAVVLNPKTETTPVYLQYGSYVSVTTYYPQTWSFWASMFGESINKSTFSVTKDYVTDYVSYTPSGYTN